MVEVIRGWRDLPDSQRGAAAAIGTFDGVHRGHQAVIASAREAAQRLGVPLAVVSFDPHPRRLFQPEAAPFRLMTADQMARALAPLGVDRLYLIPFDAEMAGMTDEQRLMSMQTMFGSDAIRAANILYKEGADGVRKFTSEMMKVTALDDSFRPEASSMRSVTETVKPRVWP